MHLCRALWHWSAVSDSPLKDYITAHFCLWVRRVDIYLPNLPILQAFGMTAGMDHPQPFSI